MTCLVVIVVIDRGLIEEELGMDKKLSGRFEQCQQLIEQCGQVCTDPQTLRSELCLKMLEQELLPDYVAPPLVLSNVQYILVECHLLIYRYDQQKGFLRRYIKGDDKTVANIKNMLHSYFIGIEWMLSLYKNLVDYPHRSKLLNASSNVVRGIFAYLFGQTIEGVVIESVYFTQARLLSKMAEEEILDKFESFRSRHLGEIEAVFSLICYFFQITSDPVRYLSLLFGSNYQGSIHLLVSISRLLISNKLLDSESLDVVISSSSNLEQLYQSLLRINEYRDIFSKWLLEIIASQHPIILLETIDFLERCQMSTCKGVVDKINRHHDLPAFQKSVMRLQEIGWLNDENYACLYADKSPIQLVELAECIIQMGSDISFAFLSGLGNRSVLIMLVKHINQYAFIPDKKHLFLNAIKCSDPIAFLDVWCFLLAKGICQEDGDKAMNVYLSNVESDQVQVRKQIILHLDENGLNEASNYLCVESDRRKAECIVKVHRSGVVISDLIRCKIKLANAETLEVTVDYLMKYGLLDQLPKVDDSFLSAVVSRNCIPRKTTSFDARCAKYLSQELGGVNDIFIFFLGQLDCEYTKFLSFFVEQNLVTRANISRVIKEQHLFSRAFQCAVRVAKDLSRQLQPYQKYVFDQTFFDCMLDSYQDPNSFSLTLKLRVEQVHDAIRISSERIAEIKYQFVDQNNVSPYEEVDRVICEFRCAAPGMSVDFDVAAELCEMLNRVRGISPKSYRALKAEQLLSLVLSHSTLFDAVQPGLQLSFKMLLAFIWVRVCHRDEALSILVNALYRVYWFMKYHYELGENIAIQLENDTHTATASEVDQDDMHVDLTGVLDPICTSDECADGVNSDSEREVELAPPRLINSAAIFNLLLESFELLIDEYQSKQINFCFMLDQIEMVISQVTSDFLLDIIRKNPLDPLLIKVIPSLSQSNRRLCQLLWCCIENTVYKRFLEMFGQKIHEVAIYRLWKIVVSIVPCLDLPLSDAAITELHATALFQVYASCRSEALNSSSYAPRH